MKNNKNNNIVLLTFLVSILIASSCASAVGEDITVGADQLIYEPGENTTITGYVLSSTTHRPVAYESITITITDPDGATLDTQTKTTNSQGLYQSDPITLPDEGTYDIISYTTTGRTETSITVEGKKRYTLTTNSYTYQPNQTVTVTLKVETLDSEGAVVSATSGAEVPIKITRKSDGVTVASGDVTTNSDGLATMNHTINVSSSAYSDYSVIAGNGQAVALFKVPSFNAKVQTIDSNSAIKTLYSSSDNLYLKVTASVDTDSGNTIPITSADIKAYVINSQGTKIATITQYTESPSGTYTSSNYSLSGFTNGEYAVKVDITKNNLTQSTKTKFNVKSLRVDIIPIFEKDKVKAVMKGGNASLGLYIVDLATGAEISGNAITSATVTECKDSNWKDCITEVTSYPTLSDGYEEIGKILTVGMPNRTGDIYLKVRVNTTSGNGIGEVYLSQQNIMVLGEIKDSFNNMRWEFGSGETVLIEAKVFGTDWQPKENIANVTIEEIRDDNWDDIKSTIINLTSNSHIKEGSTINFTAPTESGSYFVKLKVMTSDGDKGYAYEEFRVSKYKIWVDVKNTNDEWKWKFSSTETIDFYANVYDLRGTAISTSNYKLSIQALYNEMTGKKYSDNLNSTDMGSVGDSTKIRLNLGSTNVDSGYYRAEFRFTDMDGNEEEGNAWFQISNLDVWADTKTSPSGNYEWQYSPTDNITYEITVRHFNGTSIAGARVSLEEVMLMQDGPSMPLSTSRYTKSNATYTNDYGRAYLWIKPVSGMTLPQGNQMALITINASGTTENAEGWFDIRVIKTSAQLERNAGIWSFGKTENVSIIVSAKKLADNTNINATATLLSLKDTNTWNDVDTSRYSASPVTITSESGVGKITFPATNLQDGQYEAKIRVSATDFTASAEQYIWFEVKSYTMTGSFTNTKSSYSPGETMSMRITVKYPNGTAYSNAGIKVYQFADTESNPWNFVTTVNSNQLATTDSNGIATITFAAPQTSGRYHPMMNITTVSNGESTNPWEMPDFTVRSSDININLYTYNSTTRRGISQTDKFLPNTTVMTNVITRNPETGELDSNVGYIKLVKYKNLNTQAETTLDMTKSTSLIGNDNITFRTPTDLGEYILYVTVNSSNNILTEKTWFKVDMDVKFFMERWTYSKSDNITINIDSANPDGSASDIDVELRKIKSWTEDRTYIENEEDYKNIQTITGNGQYTIPLSEWDSSKDFQLGEYEAELCIYGVGSECTEKSRRLYIGFSIQTIKAEGWSWQPTYTADEDILLVTRANNENGASIDPSTFTATLSGIRYMTTDENATSNFTLNDEDSLFDAGWETFKSINITPDANIASGEYIATVVITSGSSTRNLDIWFRIADFKLTVEALNLEGDQQWTHKFMTGENITLSITTGNSNDYNGTIRIMDDKSWTQIGGQDIEILDGTATTNISVQSSGRYSAIVEVENAMEGFWMDIGSYDISIDHWASEHEYEPGENISVIFDVRELDGSPYTSTITVSAVTVRNRWDWSCISGDCSNQGSDNYIYTNTILMGSPQTFSFDPGNLGGGEFNVELLFSTGDTEYWDGFGFNIRTSIFDVWPEMNWGQNNFEPGSNATFRAYLAYPNGTPMTGANISIELIEDPTKWSPEERDMTGKIIPYTMSALTDSEGNAELKIGLNETYTGEMELAFRENNGNQVRYTRVMISGYEANLIRNWEIWRFMPGDNYTADLYVYKSGTPAANLSVYLKSRYPDGQNWDEIIYQKSLGVTDSSGHVSINYELDPNNYTLNGNYMIQLDIANGAASIEDWFKVQSFIVDDRLYGNNSNNDYSRDVGAGDEVTIDLYIKDANNNVMSANATLLELRNPQNWQEIIPFEPMVDDEGRYYNVSETDSIGRATLKFYAPGDKGEYVARVNVTTGSSSTMQESWFRVMPYTINIEMLCPDGTDTCSDKYLKSAGNPVMIKTTADGENIQNIRVCIPEVRNTYTGLTYGEGCREEANNTLYFDFPAASQSGDYDARVTVEIDEGNGYEMAKEENVWFQVLGEGEYQMNVWFNELGGWPGNNISAFVELRNPMSWEDIDELTACESIEITDIKDTYTWQTIATVDNIEQSWGERSDCYGCPEVELSFVTPNGDPGEYEITIQAVCDDVSYERKNMIQIKAFQASTLMPSKIKANETVPVWLRVTDYDGNIVSGAEVNVKEIRNTWTGDVVRTIETTMIPDSLGEVSYNLTTPEKEGEYELVMEVKDTNSGLMQKVTRWFRIAGMVVTVELNGNEFFTGDTINYTINVTDAFTHQPIANAMININFWGSNYGDDDAEEPEEGDMEGSSIEIMIDEPEEGDGEPSSGGGFGISTTTNENGISSGNLSAFNLDAGEYGMGINVFTDTKGSTFREETFIIKNYNIVATLPYGLEYTAGDTITINLAANDSQMNPLNSSYRIETCIESMMMKGMEEEEESDINCTNTTLGAEGTGTALITLPENTTAGPGVLFFTLYNSSDNEIDWAPYLIVIHSAGGGINYTFDATGSNEIYSIAPSTMFGISLQASSSDIQKSPDVIHLKKTGNAVPMNQMMGGGEESNKEDMFETAMFLNSTGHLHMKILSRQEPGIYYAFMPFMQKGVTSKSETDIMDVALVNYRVI